MSPRLVSSVLVGRAAELDLIDAAFARARRGEPAVVLLAGEAGVGKTRLAAEGAARAEAAGALVLRGACVQLGGEGLPFVPIVDALRELARATPAEDLDRVLGPARADLGRLLPELDPDGVAGGEGQGSTSRLFDSVLGVIGRLAVERPLVLVVEDLHWADRSTLDLLAFVVRSLRSEAVLLVLTYRSDELHRRHPLRPLLVELERLRNVERCRLGRFDREGVAAQLAAILGERPSESLVDRVFERSEGNAFLVEEVLDVVRSGDEETLSESLRDVLLARTDRLSEEARRVLQVTAVGGRRVSHAVLSEVASLSEADLYAALRECVEHQVLEVDGDAYAFRHTMLRDAVYDDMLPGEGVRLHAAYAAALSAVGDQGSGGAAPASELAHHLYAAHDLAGALPVMLEAARQAAAAYAHAEAQRHLERALEVWSRVPDAEQRTGLDELAVLERTIRAATDAGNDTRAVLLTDQALAEVDEAREPARKALLLEHKAYLLRNLGRTAGIEELEAAVALLPAEPTRERAIVLASLATTLVNYSSDFERGGELARQAADVAQAAGAVGEEAKALISLGVSLGYTARIEEGISAIREGARLAEEVGDADGVLRAQINLSDVCAGAGRHHEAIEAAVTGIALARSCGMLRSRGAFLMGNQAESLFRLGRWDEAEQLIEEAAAIDTMGVHAATARLLRAEILVARGRYAEAEEHARAAARQIGDAPLQYGLPLAFLLASTAWGSGELDAAAALVARDVDRWNLANSPRYGWPLLWIGMRIAADRAERGRHDAQPVPEDVARLEALAETLGAVNRDELAFRELVEAEALRARGEPAAARFAAAVSAWRIAGVPYMVAYALLRVAEAECGGGGDRDRAREALRESFGLARQIGAAPLVEEAGALARRARVSLTASGERNGDGAAAEPPGSAAQLGLTPRELDVLRLVAAGRSNGEIAAELFISPKTASVHVSNILGKLRVTGRVQAASAAHRLGLFAGDEATP